MFCSIKTLCYDNQNSIISTIQICSEQHDFLIEYYEDGQNERKWKWNIHHMKLLTETDRNNKKINANIVTQGNTFLKMGFFTCSYI